MPFAAELGDPMNANKYTWTGGNPYNLDPTKVDWSSLGANTAQQKRDMITSYMTTGKLPSGGGGGAGAGGSLAGGAGQAQNAANELSQFGSGMMDPNSDYYKKMLQRMQQSIGAQTAGANRGAALTAAEQGFGAGLSPQQAQMIAGNTQAGQKAMGSAMTDLSLAAPGMGIQALGAGGNLSLGVGQLGESARQANQNLAETGRQFDVGSGFTAQQLAQAADAQAFNQKMAKNQDLLKMYSMMFGMM